MNNQKLSVIILGAGKGTRMKSTLSKVLHKVVGIPMIKHVVNTAKTLKAKEIIAVVSEENKKQIQEALEDDKVKLAVQKDQNGTGGAVKVGLKYSELKEGNTLVMYGDVPLITPETYSKMAEEINNGNNSIVVLGFNTANIENKYGRLIAGKNGELKEIVEYKDATEDERNITLCNSGVVIVKTKVLPELLKEVKNENASKEYYLTDIVGIARKKDLNCKYIVATENEVMGVNSKIHLAEAEKILQNRLREKFMARGVTLIDPQTVYFACDTEIGKDVIIYPNVFFEKDVKIGNGVIIESFSHLEKCTIEKNVYIRHSTSISNCKIGENTNIGVNTITCHHDGYNQYETKIGKNCLIGANTIMVAPIKLGDNVITGAGSVITRDVGKDDIVISRSEQINLQGKATKYRKKREGK